MFGANLRKVRKMYRLSQAEVGERLGVSQRTVSDWEQEKTEPDLDTLLRITKLFDVTFEELMES